MTLRSLIDRVNKEKPNTFTQDDLIGYANTIEKQVGEQLRLHIIPTYTSDDMNKTLLAPAPYDALYVSFLKAMIDQALEEWPSYQVDVEQHREDFRELVDHIVREGLTTRTMAPRKIKNVM